MLLARLCDMGLTDCKPLQELWKTWWRNRKLDMCGNNIPKKELRRLIGILEKHCTGERKTFFLAIGDDHSELLRGSCDPNGYCPCARGTVHIVGHLRAPLERPSTPPTPSTTAPKVQQTEVCAASPALCQPETVYELALEFSLARPAMQRREAEAVDAGDAVMLSGKTYFVQTCPRHTSGVNQYHLAAICGSVAVGPTSPNLIVAMEKLSGTPAGEALMTCDPAYHLRLADVAKCLVDITGCEDMPSPPGPCRLLGREVKQVRKTSEHPPRISVVDVAMLITGKDARKAAQDVGYVKERYPELAQDFGTYKFPGRRQRDTAVCDARSLAELAMLLPGKHAARVRKAAAELLVKFLGGDLSLVDDVVRNRGIQE